MSNPNARPGTYALVLAAVKRQVISVGRLGIFDVRPGFYVYVGSALGPGGLAARIGRHARQGKALRWHVDYLRAVTDMVEAWFSQGRQRWECLWAERLAVDFAPRTSRTAFAGGRFSASDRLNRRRLLPTVPIQPEFEPTRWSREDDDEKVIHDFRQMIRRRLGGLGVAVLDVRLAGGETKSVIGRPELGSPDKNIVKRVVQQVKGLAREYAGRLGDPGFLRDIERAMGREAATVGKRRAAMAVRRAVVGA